MRALPLVACGLTGCVAAQAVELAAGDTVTCAVAGDVNGDGAVDLLFGSDKDPVLLLLGDGQGRFTPVDGALGGETKSVTALALIDLDNDGKLDVLLGGDGCLTRLWINAGDGHFHDHSSRLPLDKPSVKAIAIGNLDGDGKDDVVLANFNGPNFVYRSDEGRLVGIANALPKTAERAHSVAVADLDDDGNLDLVFARQPTADGEGGGNQAFRNDGKGRFTDMTATWMPSDQDRTRCLALADLDGDGAVELVCGNRGKRIKEGSPNTVHRRGRDGRFLGSARSRYNGAPDATSAVALVDIDGDGDVDLLFGNDGPETMFLNDGKGHFLPADRLPQSDDDTCALLVTDVDGDGYPDVVAANRGGPSRLYLNGGAGRFDTNDAPPPLKEGRPVTDLPPAVAGTPKPPDATRLAQGKYALRIAGRKRLPRAPARNAVANGLQFLARYQGTDGRFDGDRFVVEAFDPSCDGLHDVAVTDLAALCFLGEYSLPNHAIYHDHVERAIAWLVAQQSDDGLFGTDASLGYVYHHAIATLALAEALLLSGDERWRTPLQKATARLEAWRNPEGVWRYQPRGGDGDTSVTAWCTEAWCAAKDCGVASDHGVPAYVLVYLDEMTDLSGRTGYSERGGRSVRRRGKHEIDFPADRYEGMTGAALFARLLLGESLATSVNLRNGAELVVRKRPAADQFDAYSWMHCANALAQCGGLGWDTWRTDLHKALLARQVEKGDLAGSFAPHKDVWGMDSGRFGTTALCLLALQAEYRYAPMLDAQGRRRVRR